MGKKATKSRKKNAPTPQTTTSQPTDLALPLTDVPNGVDCADPDDLQDGQTGDDEPELGPTDQRSPSPSVEGDADADRGGAIPATTADRNGLSQALAPLDEPAEHDVSDLATLKNLISVLQDDRTRLTQECADLAADRDSAQDQYKQLREKVSKITAQLSTKIHNYENTIADSTTRIEDLEDQKIQLDTTVANLERRLSTISLEKTQLVTEIDLLRSRSELAHTNFAKERQDLGVREKQLLEDLQLAHQARQDWEVLAMEERAQRETLGERAGELEEQLAVQKEALSKSQGDCVLFNQTVSDLQRALSEVQTAHRTEIQDRVEQSDDRILSLKKQLNLSENEAATAKQELELVRAEAADKIPLERELKEKRLQIGKLRHETVILNDHLTKALRFLKQRKPEEMVDREIVTNHFLHFLTLDRADPKKFQVLQLIAALLSWSDEQREQAGLFRPGTSFSTALPRTSSSAAPAASSLMSSLSLSFRRPSGTSTASEGPQAYQHQIPPPSPGFLKTPPISSNRESLAELWSAFLEREATEGTPAGQAGSGAGPSALGLVSPSEGSTTTTTTTATTSQTGDGDSKT